MNPRHVTATSRSRRQLTHTHTHTHARAYTPIYILLNTYKQKVTTSLTCSNKPLCFMPRPIQTRTRCIETTFSTSSYQACQYHILTTKNPFWCCLAQVDCRVTAWYHRL